MKNLKEFASIAKGRVLLATSVITSAIVVGTPMFAYASDSGSGVDIVGQATTVVTMVKEVMSLFTTFPLNILLVIGILGGVIGLFGRAKKTASPGN